MDRARRSIRDTLRRSQAGDDGAEPLLPDLDIETSTPTAAPHIFTPSLRRQSFEVPVDRGSSGPDDRDGRQLWRIARHRVGESKADFKD